jgi:hypothetical protein
LVDFVGDVHGRADQLHTLLAKLGYKRRGGIYGHPNSEAVFVGDLINKGKQNREVLSTVKAMVDAGKARVVLGNHERNLIGLFHKHKRHKYIQAPTEKNRMQHEPTFKSFADDQPTLQGYIRWMRQLPLFLETDTFRVAHACWHQPSIAFLGKYFPQNCLDDYLLDEMVPGSEVALALQQVLEGPRLPLPNQQESTFKAKWWYLQQSDAYQELSVRPEIGLGNPRVNAAGLKLLDYQYPEDEKPFFFGHYNLPGQLVLTGNNYTCLDFNTEDHPLLVAYRWEGEQTLDSRKFFWV